MLRLHKFSCFCKTTFSMKLPTLLMKFCSQIETESVWYVNASNNINVHKTSTLFMALSNYIDDDNMAYILEKLFHNPVSLLVFEI